MYIDAKGLLYSGDLKPGDRIATSAEVAEFERFKQIQRIKSDLIALDLKRIRSVSEGDTEYLAQLNAQAVELRAQLNALGG